MADTEPSDLPVVDPAIPRCRHLRNKGMYVYSDGMGREPHEDYDNSIFWCIKTMKEYGPDDDIVGGHDCHNPERTCYEPF